MEQNRSGRPKEYCDKRCRDAAYRASRAKSSPDAERYSQYVRELSEELARLTDRLVKAAHTDDATGDLPLRVLRLAAEVERGLSDVRFAAVQQARTRKVRAAEIAGAMSVTPVKLRTDWSAHAAERRMQHRMSPSARADGARQDDADGQPGAGWSTGPVFVPRQRRPDPTGQDPGPAPEPDTLARALTTLQRLSGRTLRELGKKAGVSASYVSRVLAGKRRPSWRLAQCLAEACGGDPADILPLWKAARGLAARPAGPDTLHAALRGLHLAAQRPAPELIHTASHGLLSTDDINSLLNGRRTPDWPTVDRFVHALGGQPEAFLPLWHAARPPMATPAQAGTGHYPAAAFG
ncbi:helix-turn-helix domain-containing protein [Streptomyces sp. NBC_01803]|uniref:helix-turn-helix domain-containing protein n=1 Tax=Streptomyces sp. NBC_01803 TaxID=2975946 RepID=UPI002DDB68F1|nr:helix-turn-helix transcriptional regulator [Streptomyces sp. NBC_01803]WSA43583.1 helix-turn-helix domain-containing protein [Streptomyces sp. NBC_01803]